MACTRQRWAFRQAPSIERAQRAYSAVSASQSHSQSRDKSRTMDEEDDAPDRRTQQYGIRGIRYPHIAYVATDTCTSTVGRVPRRSTRGLFRQLRRGCTDWKPDFASPDACAHFVLFCRARYAQRGFARNAGFTRHPPPLTGRTKPTPMTGCVWVILKLHAIHKPFISGVRGSMTAGTDSRLVLDS